MCECVLLCMPMNSFGTSVDCLFCVCVCVWHRDATSFVTCHTIYTSIYMWVCECIRWMYAFAILLWKETEGKSNSDFSSDHDSNEIYI